ncbi:glycosyltransferase family 2 protein [Roseisalinus antarcticus]|uniref:Glycosyl transferase family 2 n=1 Tax=Roseisalinus antarcticus TaxID=254357 RepID=A0A1Y5RLE9_9RHOB|nr:glycosyltransferase family 2 protein [Roseisalinus antarcticus]SLN17489.1 Glycosyl transferase family 2 [Roseisalinus antarcticus]
MAEELVIIAAATRGRAEMFQSLLLGLSQLEAPPQARLGFVFVQNDPDFSIDFEVARFARQTGRRALALHEPRAGIPVARNVAVDAALKAGADWLAFLDDDERPAPDWIARLLAGARGGDFDLCGGPVMPLPPSGALSPRQTAVMAFLAAQAAARALRREAGDVSALPTSNWLCRGAVLKDLRFDEGLRFTGGSDTDFSDRAQARGLRLGWVPGAAVFETIPRERLTGAYVYRRAKSQTLAKYAIRQRKRGRRGLGKALFHGLTKGAGGLLRAAFLPVHPVTGLRGLRSLGVAAGWLSGALGRESDLYRP